MFGTYPTYYINNKTPMWDSDEKSIVEGEYDRPGVSGHRLSVIKDIVVGHEESCNLHGSSSNLYRMFIKCKTHMWDPDEKSVVEGEYDRPGVSGLGLSVIRNKVVSHENCNIYRTFINTFVESPDMYWTYPTYKHPLRPLNHKTHMWDPDEKSVIEGNMIDQKCQDSDFP